MKIRLLFITLIIVLSFTGCKIMGAEKPNPNEIEVINTGEIVEEELIETIIEDDEIESDEEIVKTYMGQALDTIDKNGIVEIYKEKSMDSEIIHRMNDFEEIELIETLPYGWYKVRLEDGQEGYGDARYIRAVEIPPHDFDEDVEGHALLYTQEDQTLKIYKDGDIVLESKASGGLWDYFTPKGVFEIEKGRRGGWFYVPRFEQGMKYWVGFKGTYLFHSLPFTEDQQLIEEEAEKLGEAASHGCVRLPVDVAKYIYDNVEEGALVIID